ncbi:hypothetical protein GGQ03_000600 [Salinibacter ruber]|jgi:hypothetical protein|nr:hypothetical protein [Salinibacter ruber]
MPKQYGNWKTVYDRFRRVPLAARLSRFCGICKANSTPKAADWSHLSAHSTIVEAARAAAGGPMGDTKGPELSETRA